MLKWNPMFYLIKFILDTILTGKLVRIDVR